MWSQTLFTIQETPITLLNLSTFVATLLLSWMIAKSVRSLLTRLVSLKESISSPSLYGLGHLAYYMILFIGSYIAFLILGIDLTGITVIIGAISIGIGFGLQSTFNNLMAGVILLIEKKVRVGDLIELDSGEIGYVLSINVRSTLICILDNRKILIPNTEIVSQKLINWSLGDTTFHRFRVPFTVSREAGKEIVKGLALDVALKIGSKEMRPEVWLTQIKRDTQEFELILWMERKKKGLSSTSLTASCLWNLDIAFAEKGIKLLEAKRQSESTARQEL